MSTANVFSVSCSEMGPHEASLQYNGVMCQAGALALESQLKRLFGYFKYPRMVLSIESPGGAIDGLDYVLRVIQNWAKEGRAVAVGSTFQCASAAAFLLAMGEWGRRRVDRGTFLLVRPAWAHSCGCKSRRKLTMTNEVKRNCTRVTDCGKEAWSINHEPMDKNRIEGTAEQGERANNRKALLVKVQVM